MAESANVQSVQALQDVKDALGRFAGEAQAELRASELEIRRTLDWLQERLNYWLNEVRRGQDEERHVANALARCQASGSYDRDGRYCAPNCGGYEQALRQVQARLHEAQAERHNVEHWIHQVQEAAGRCQMHLRRLRETSEGHTDRARAFLGSRLDELAAYLAVAAGAATVGPVFLNAVHERWHTFRNAAGRHAVEAAKRQEIQLVKATLRGTRDWKPKELDLLKNGEFPKGYYGHHINNFVRFPDLATNPDNIRFVTWKEHFALHRRDWHNNTSGRMFNRKSLMVQWHP